jgi:hypothetical protein
MQPKTILNTSHVAHRLGVDRRTVIRRMEKTRVSPDFVSPSGETFFLDETANRLTETLKSHSAPQEVASR